MDSNIKYIIIGLMMFFLAIAGSLIYFEMIFLPNITADSLFHKKFVYTDLGVDIILWVFMILIPFIALCGIATVATHIKRNGY